MKRDEVFIKHILDEIDFLKTQSRNLDFEDLMKNEVLKRAWDILWDVVKNKLPRDRKEFRKPKRKRI